MKKRENGLKHFFVKRGSAEKSSDFLKLKKIDVQGKKKTEEKMTVGTTTLGVWGHSAG